MILRILVFLHLKIKQLFDFFWKQFFSFHVFFLNVNCLLMCYTVKRMNCLLKVIIGAQYFTPLFLALLVQELCVWLAENKKTWTWCSNGIQTWMKEIQHTSPFLHCVGEYSCSVIWAKLFFNTASRCSSTFSRNALLRKRLQVYPI